MSDPKKPLKRPWNKRLTTIVDRKYQFGFAFRILAAQVIAILALQAAIQLRITAALRHATTYAMEDILTKLFSETLLTLVVVGPVVGGLVVLLALRLSNRLIGPVPRLRRAMKAIADGDYGTRLVFRPGDMLEPVADDFNALAAALQRRHGDVALPVAKMVPPAEADLESRRVRTIQGAPETGEAPEVRESPETREASETAESREDYEIQHDIEALTDLSLNR